LNALTLVGSSDDADVEAGGTSTETSSLVTVNATVGTTYYVQTDGNSRSGLPPMNARFVLTLNDSVWQGVMAATVTCSPTIGPDGAVYVGSADGFLHAFNADGTRRWPAINLNGATLDTSAAALASDGTLYFGTGPRATQANSARLYAYNSTTGARKWEIVVGTGVNANNAVGLGPDGTIYVHSDEGRLFAYTDRGSSVAQKWSAAVPGNSYAGASIAADGTIYLGCDDTSLTNPVHRLFAFNPADGTTKWSFAVDSPIYSSAAIDASGNIYFGTLTSGRLYSVTPAGLQRWIYRGATLGNSSSPALSPDGGTVYFAGYDGLVHAVETATGAARWTFRLGNEVRASSPAVDASGVIYIGCYDGLVYAINPNGTLKHTWATGDIVRSSPAIAGQNLYVGSNDQHLYVFETGSSGTSSAWSQYRQNARRTGRADPESFTVVTLPASQLAIEGLPLTLNVVVSGEGPFTYQWSKDGAPIAGATAATYRVTSVTAATAGTYAVTIKDPQRTLTTAPALIRVEPLNAGRLTNLSVRTSAGIAEQTLTVGFVLSGTPDKAVLIRAIGPTLGEFGVTDALSDPLLQLYSGQSVLTTNDNWSNSANGDAPIALADAFAVSGAFALRAGSLDAALVRSMNGGNYTAQITGASGTGIALAEIYDIAPASGARLVNVSARAQVGTGNNILIAGFNVSGNVPKQVLIRGVGPALSAFGVDGLLANPRLDLYRGTTLLQGNDDWGGGTTLTNVFAQIGAFGLGSASSRDAALLVTLPPGSYTAQVSGVGNTTGVALVEVYEVP
jgi:outer membrane protein assembly factor BamB